jgi:hypothetical protein
VAPSTTGDSSSVVTFPVTITLTDPGDDVRSGMSSDVGSPSPRPLTSSPRPLSPSWAPTVTTRSA